MNQLRWQTLPKKIQDFSFLLIVKKTSDHWIANMTLQIWLANMTQLGPLKNYEDGS